MELNRAPVPQLFSGSIIEFDTTQREKFSPFPARGEPAIKDLLRCFYLCFTYSTNICLRGSQEKGEAGA